MRKFAVSVAALTTLFVSSCKHGETSADEQARHVEEVVAMGGIVDSIHPLGEHLRRFRATVDSTDSLINASPSLDALVSRWTDAVSRRDSAALNDMVLSRAEFAWLYYPGSRLTLPPYEAPPELVWGQILASSNEGVAKVLRRFSGHRLTVLFIDCPPPLPDGSSIVYERCSLKLGRDNDAPVEGRFFGTILERDGNFKFIGLSSEF